MQLNHLALINFRNYAYQEISFEPGINLIYGGNAQGKTNLLESVYMTASGQSFKSGPEKNRIRFGERSCYIRSDILRQGRKKNVELKLSMVERKRIRVNEVELENLRELSTLFEAVIFASADLELLQGSPQERRQFLDSMLKAIDPLYGAELSAYQRVLFQRNQMLKNGLSQWFDEQLIALDQQLSDYGGKLIRKRNQLLKEVSPWITDRHLQLTDGKENLQVSYETNASEENEQFLELLRKNRQRDMEMKNTEIGPHKDDIIFQINGIPARIFASQGQARTATLSCKLMEMSLLEKKNGIRPILLLDDVFSELDRHRARFLLKTIEPYQTLLTTNEADALDLGSLPGAKFYVHNGHIDRR